MFTPLKIAWYPGTKREDIEVLIKKACNLPSDSEIFLYDQEGSLFVLSDHVPQDELFTVLARDHATQSEERKSPPSMM